MSLHGSNHTWEKTYQGPLTQTGKSPPRQCGDTKPGSLQCYREQRRNEERRPVCMRPSSKAKAVKINKLYEPWKRTYVNMCIYNQHENKDVFRTVISEEKIKNTHAGI